MKKYKKIITGLILALICAILPFVGVAKVKAAITSVSELKNTSWILNETLVFNTGAATLVASVDNGTVLATFEYGSNTMNITKYGGSKPVVITVVSSTNVKALRFAYHNGSSYNNLTVYDGGWQSSYGLSPRRLKFYDFEYTQTGDFLAWLQANATQEIEEPTTRTIPFKIGVILGNSGTAQTDEIYLPFNDDTVSFSVDFTPTKLINGQIIKAPGEDIRELIFQNGKKIFYTVYYNEDNVDFKLNFYGEELQVFLAVMHNTINQDNEGNYLPASQTYSSGLTSTDIDNLNNTGVYSASFEIQIPQEADLVSGHFLELRIGINPYVNDEENNENISNIMTGIFTLISSFLSIQLGFITLGQIIGLVLAIGVIFFIFYVWNGGRNGN